MRVLLVQISDSLNSRGGAIAAYRLHLGLKNAGIKSNLVCARKTLACHGIQALPEDDAQRATMGDLGREMVLQEYTIEQQPTRHIELYKKMLDSRWCQAAWSEELLGRGAAR